MDKDWIENITGEDLSGEDIKLVAELCGLDIAILLVKNLAGGSIFVPACISKKARNRYIIKNYDGTRRSIIELSKKTNLSQRHIYHIVKEGNEE